MNARADGPDRQSPDKRRDTREAMRELLSTHNLSPSQACILMAIHLRMGQDGSGWVSQDDIKSFSHLGQTAITNNTNALEKANLLEVTHRTFGSERKPNLSRSRFSTPSIIPRFRCSRRCGLRWACATTRCITSSRRCRTTGSAKPAGGWPRRFRAAADTGRPRTAR